MKTLLRALAFAAALFTALSATAQESAPPYKLQAGDMVSISVWKDASLDKEVRVLPDGSVTFPLAGRVPVAGLTTTEAEQRLAAKLKEFITDPQVSVVITDIQGNRVYVLGKVVKPGAIVLGAPMTVAQALSVAGGLDKFASGNDVQVLRNTGGRKELMRVRYNDLLDGKSLDTNVELQSGDTVLVP